MDAKAGRQKNISQLTPVNEDNVLKCLLERFKKDNIYTASGTTLIAINPFKSVPHMYDEEVMVKYHKKGSTIENDLEPHVFLLAERAFSMLSSDMNSGDQSVIISGESGAGKTVSTKLVMQYLTTVSMGSISYPSAGDAIERRILHSNPILEAFGNAVTIRNENSSRFGKFIKLQFSRDHKLIGAHIQTYLLEKTRVTFQNGRESNFHIFYQMLHAADVKSKIRWCISDKCTQDFSLTRHNIRRIVHDQSAWENLLAAMTEVGLSQYQQESIFKVVCALLYLGNISFVLDSEEDEVCVLAENGADDDFCNACQLLGLEKEKVQKTILYREIAALHNRRKSIFHKPCSMNECFSRRDCIAKLLYQRLFEFLVEFINSTIKSEESHSSIGILDIYGFESFTNNSLEQLCINYANEKLQQHFVAHFLREIQEEYVVEAIPWTFTQFSDNSSCLDILEGQKSVFSVINELCYLNRSSSDSSLCERLENELSDSKHIHFPKVKHLSSCRFALSHYASEVDYEINGFIEKNMDNIPSEFMSLLSGSSFEFVANLFHEIPLVDAGRKKKTVFSKFKMSLDNLMGILKNTHPHYIRCIKPNHENLPCVFHNDFVVNQLNACGVLDAVRIFKNGYPAKMSYTDFLQRYGLLLRSAVHQPDIHHSVSDENKENDPLIEPLNILYKQQIDMKSSHHRSTTPKRRLRRRAALSSIDHTRKCCATILKFVFGQEYLVLHPITKQFGRSKLFLRDGQLEALETNRNQILSRYVFTIQCAWRRHLFCWKKKQLNAAKIQAAVRGWLTRKHIRKLNACAIIIQTKYRCFVRSQKLCNIEKSASGINMPLPSSERVDPVENSVSDTCTDYMKDVTEDFGNSTIPETYNMLQKDFSFLCTDLRLPLKASLQQVMSEIASGKPVTYPSLGHLEVGRGILTRRRLPRVAIKFHTKANPVLKCGHYVSWKELCCSLTDCLPNR